MTEGYIWTDIYPESKRIVDKGNNQSMELHNKLTKGKWTKDENGRVKFFIINEAVIQKLCILGENVEPCFEGAGIAAQFSFDDEFKNNLYSMMNELKQALQEGGETQMTEEIKNPEVEQEEVPATEDTEFKKKPEEEEEEEKKNPSSEGEKDSEDEEDSDESKKDEEDDEDEKKKKKMNHAASED